VKLIVQVDPYPQICLSIHPRLKIRCALELVGAKTFNALPDGEGLEEDPQFVNLPDVGKARLLNDRSSIIIELDQTLGRELAQCFSYRGGTDAQGRRNFRLHEARSGLQNTSENSTTERLVGLFPSSFAVRLC
jgi:hypothetical protein